MLKTNVSIQRHPSTCVRPNIQRTLTSFATHTRTDFVEGKSVKGVKYRVYTMPGVTKQGEFALDVGMKVLDFFSEYFNNAYPLPKMDMVAIPDFSAGAMENW